MLSERRAFDPAEWLDGLAIPTRVVNSRFKDVQTAKVFCYEYTDPRALC